MLLREEFNLIRVVLGGGVGIAFDLAHTGRVRGYTNPAYIKC
jgi:hypothetical protein